MKYQDPLVLPVLLCIPASFWKGWAVTAPGVLTIAEASSGEAVSIGTLVDTLIPTGRDYRCCMFWAYWPARSIVGPPVGAQAYCCQWVLLHGRLTPMLHWLHVSAVDDIIYGPRCGTNTKNFGTDSCIFITITILVFDRVLKLRPWYWLVVLGSGPSLLR